MSRSVKNIDKSLFVCPICGKDFIAFDRLNWVYKAYDKKCNFKLVCSYSCYRKAKEQHDKEMKYHRVVNVNK